MRKMMTALKPFRYGTRALQAGDPFETSRRDARILEAIGRASAYVPPPPDPMDALRAEASKLGIDVDGRWKEARLLAEIEKARAKPVEE